MADTPRKPVEGGRLYIVEKIIRKRVRQGIPEYLVKWAGYPTNQSTWEPRANFTANSLDLVDEFEMKMQEKKTKQSTTKVEKQHEAKEERPPLPAVVELEVCERTCRNRLVQNIVGVVDTLEGRSDTDGHYFIVKFADTDEPELVHHKLANKYFPQHVIEYYEKHVTFNDQ